MRQHEFIRVKELSVKSESIASAVSPVSDYGMTDIARMHSYLMSPARLELVFHKRIHRISLDDLIKSYRKPSVFRDRVFLSVGGTSREKIPYLSAVFLYHSVNKGVIIALSALFGYLFLKRYVCKIVFGYNEKP